MTAIQQIKVPHRGILRKEDKMHVRSIDSISAICLCTCTVPIIITLIMLRKAAKKYPNKIDYIYPTIVITPMIIAFTLCCSIMIKQEIGSIIPCMFLLIGEGFNVYAACITLVPREFHDEFYEALRPTTIAAIFYMAEIIALLAEWISQ